MRPSPHIAGIPIEAVELAGDPDARPLVLLHEGLGSVGLWRDFPGALRRATGRRVIAFSRFGHGRSGRPPAPRTPAFFHTEALDVLPELLLQLDAHGRSWSATATAARSPSSTRGATP